jgi:tetratricopeptide (TPR) repeat protein
MKPVRRLEPDKLIAGLLLLIGAAALGFWQPPAPADPLADIDSILQQSNRETSEGNYADAENHLKQALLLSVQSTGGMSSLTGKICRQLAGFMIKRGRLSEAEHFMLRALVIASGYSVAVQDADGEFRNTREFVADAVRNPEHLVGSLDVAATLSALADLRERQGNYADAERLLRRTLQIYSSGGQNAGNLLNYSPDAAVLLAAHQRRLAELLLKENKVTEAESAFKDYVETVRKDRGASPELAGALNHLAAFYRSQNRGSEAEAAAAESKDLEARFH